MSIGQGARPWAAYPALSAPLTMMGVERRWFLLSATIGMAMWNAINSIVLGAVTIRDLVRHALRHRPDHIVVGEVRGAEAADLLQALNTGHGGSLATVHANHATAALSRLASCAMQASDALPWSVVCRGVVDGIEAVIQQTRTAAGGRRVNHMVRVRDYDAAHNHWIVEDVWPSAELAETEGGTGCN